MIGRSVCSDVSKTYVTRMHSPPGLQIAEASVVQLEALRAIFDAADDFKPQQAADKLSHATVAA